MINGKRIAVVMPESRFRPVAHVFPALYAAVVSRQLSAQDGRL